MCLSIRGLLDGSEFQGLGSTLVGTLYIFQVIGALPFVTGWVGIMEEIIFNKPLRRALLCWDITAGTLQNISYGP